jgi:ethanolamine utilization protein EutA (predicted chaperonin)
MAAVRKEGRQVVVISRQAAGNWARVVQGTLIECSETRAVLTNARQALYYSRASGGEFGLASLGPGIESRISAPVPRAEMFGVGAVMDCTETAVTAWRTAPVYAGK